ncbi:RluA family pseudouridine synthase [Bdellovibrio bacteriovorus]|uniref:RluA family pseudouridine synthase n=1 Tax=Bdellovibrio bacteriovorus TaxID=959 RepID=UPI0035A6E046
MIQIVFENTHFITCDKPAGVLSTPSRFEEDDARLCLGTALQKEKGIQIYPVNRLDFEVSGLVVYAKTAEAHRKANAWFENKTVKKTYRALTTGQSYAHIPANVPNEKLALSPQVGNTFEWRCRLLRGKRRAYESPQGKECLTVAVFRGMQGEYQVWDLNPVTGRSHQLRFDLSRHGYPIVGDKLYGSTVELSDNRIALRSYRIDFANANGASALGLPEFIEVSSF